MASSEPAIDRARRLARATVVAFAVLSAFDVFQGVAVILLVASTCAECADPASSPIAPFIEGLNASIGCVMSVVCVVCYCRWVPAAYLAAVRAGVAVRPGASRRATLGFLLPIVSLYWPYLALRQFDAAIDPARLPVPAPRPAAGPHAFGYRDAAVDAPLASPPTPRPPLEIWWILWLARWTCGIPFSFDGLWKAALTRPADASPAFIAALLALDAASTVAAILVVRRIDAHLAERVRRAAALSATATAS
jgi:hypothetical protein